MIFAVDIGNTNIILAVHDGKSWIDKWRIHTDVSKTSDEYFVLINSLLNSTNSTEYHKIGRASCRERV